MMEKEFLDHFKAYIDLHLHLDGSLSEKTIKRLAKIQGIELPKRKELEELMHVSDQCRDLNTYLEKFQFPLSLLQTKEALIESLYSLEEELKEQGLMYAEIRFAPQFHCSQGLSQEEVVKAVLEGHKRSDFMAKIILCCMRMEDNEEENKETIRLAEKYREQGICAIDLAGAERIYPNEKFEQLFEEAKKRNIPFTIHAGEAMGAKSVESALSYGPQRIGHGVRCTEETRIIDRIVKEKVTLELCPTSNLHTNIYGKLSQYPLLQLIDAGVPVTVNTDNMSVSNTSIKKEWIELVKAFSLEKKEMKKILQNSIEAAFLNQEEKNYLRKKLEAAIGEY